MFVGKKITACYLKDDNNKWKKITKKQKQMNFHGRAVLIALEWQRVLFCLQVRRSFTKLRGEDLGG